MALTTSLVSVEEYLNTNYKPACEYRDGVLTRKPMATHEHSRIQGRFIQILLNRYPEFAALPELTLQLRPDRYLIPDIGVESLADVQRPYPVRPIHLCIEILSPETGLPRRPPNARSTRPGECRTIGSSTPKRGALGNMSPARA